MQVGKCTGLFSIFQVATRVLNLSKEDRPVWHLKLLDENTAVQATSRSGKGDQK